MKHVAFSVVLALTFSVAIHVASAQAQYVRTCVSANGNDANTCHCSQPCRTFQRAHDQTLDQGEMTVLDPGGYGPVTITKSISIVNDGVGEASIQVSGGGTGITVNAGNGGGFVNLRGITIQGVGFGGGTGLRFNTGFTLTMENCVVRNHTGSGIQFLPNASRNLSVSNTLVADNGGDGIAVASGVGTVKIALNKVEVYNNSFNGILAIGLSGAGTINAIVTDTVVANNGRTGFFVISTSGSATTSLMLDRSVAANNGTGLSADGAPATLRVGQSTITGNTFSWSVANSAVLRSYGDNNIDGNGDGDPAPTTTATK